MLFQRHGEEHAERKANQWQGDKQLALAGAVRERREQEHAGNGADVRQNGEHSHLADAGVRQLLQNGGQPEGVTVNASLVEEVEGDQLPHGFVRQHRAERGVFHLFTRNGLLLCRQRLYQVVFLGLRDPARFLRPVVDGERPQHQHNNGHQTFNNEQPAPVESGNNPARQRGGDDPGDGHEHDHNRVGAAALGIREPVTDHREHNGQHPTFRHAE